jgi:hypothetical protein
MARIFFLTGFSVLTGGARARTRRIFCAKETHKIKEFAGRGNAQPAVAHHKSVALARMVTKMKKHWALLACLLLSEGPSVLAQGSKDVPAVKNFQLGTSSAENMVLSSRKFSSETPATSAEPKGSSRVAAPAPQSGAWQEVKSSMELTLGYMFVRFNSSQFSASMSGINSSFTYYTSNWLAAEGEITAAFGSQSSSSFTAKYAFYGGGVKIAAPEKRIRPWAHALFGGIHLLPQTAFSRNGVAVELGGGADVRLKSGLLLRLKADYARSQVYAGGQNNFQVGTGVVYRF